MNLLHAFIPLLGRILLSSIFILSALHKLGNWAPTADQMTDKGVPFVHLFLAGAVVLELLGGLSVLLGLKARWGSVALLLFLVPVTLVMHNFWALEGEEQQQEMIAFMKNLAIMGGLLYVLAFGAGSISIDGRRQPR